MSKPTRGLIHVYTGDGKGKTTAALGLALRAAGHGWRTYVGQFMKGQDYGELEAAKMLGGLLTIEQFGKPTFIHADEVTPEDIRMAKEGLDTVRQAMLCGEYDIVVMDEINVALHFGLLTAQEVLDVIDEKPQAERSRAPSPGMGHPGLTARPGKHKRHGEVELVLTGRRAPQEILDRADYVTVMQEAKHPYEQGILARKGIEF